MNQFKHTPAEARKLWVEAPGLFGKHFAVTLDKGEERYVFLFDDAHRAETLRTLGRFASHPELSFTWYDAAVVSQEVRKGAKL